jgi:hypothetical protein
MAGGGWDHTTKLNNPKVVPYLKLIQDIITFYNEYEVTTPLISTGTPSELLSTVKYYQYNPTAEDFILKICLLPPAQPNDVYIEHRLIHGPATSASSDSRIDSGFVGSSETLSHSDEAALSHKFKVVHHNREESTVLKTMSNVQLSVVS